MGPDCGQRIGRRHNRGDPPGDLATLGHRGENNPITVKGVVRFLAPRTPNRS